MRELVPIFAYFAVGAILRRLNFASAEQAQFLFRLVFFVTLPPLAFTTIAGSDLGPESVSLPIIGFIVNLVCASLAYFYARLAGLDLVLTGTVIVGASVANSVFVFPFVLGILGPEALAKAVLYDIGNAIFVGSIAYGVALRCGSGRDMSLFASLGRILGPPMFLAVLAGIVVNMGNWKVPSPLELVLAPLGDTTVPLVLLALGMSFTVPRLRDTVVFSSVAIRMLGGFLVGAFSVVVLGLEGTTALIVIATAAAPIGFNAVTLASVGKLDTEHATASLSMSVVAGLVTTSAIVMIGSALF